jgi:hypothetical protein
MTGFFGRAMVVQNVSRGMCDAISFVANELQVFCGPQSFFGFKEPVRSARFPEFRAREPSTRGKTARNTSHNTS